MLGGSFLVGGDGVEDRVIHPLQDGDAGHNFRVSIDFDDQWCGVAALHFLDYLDLCFVVCNNLTTILAAVITDVSGV